MRARCGALPSPSPAVLRFLRTQAKESTFFTASSVSPPSHHIPRCSSSHGNVSRLQQKRHLAASASCGADVTLGLLPPHSFTASVLPVCQSNLLGAFALSKSLQQPRDSSSERRWTGRRSPAASQSWFRRLIDRGGRERHDAQLNEAKASRLPSFLDGSTGTAIGRNKAGKAGSEVKLRCTEIDENGNVITVDREFKKSELIAKVETPHPSGDSI